MSWTHQSRFSFIGMGIFLSFVELKAFALLPTLFQFILNIVLLTEAEYFYFSADFRLKLTLCMNGCVACAVASWLVRSSPERAVRVRALAGDIVLCSWARHLTLTVPLSTQVYKWVPVNCRGKPNKLRGNDLRWTSILSRGSRNTPGHFMLQKPGISSGSYGPLGSRLHFSFKAER